VDALILFGHVIRRQRLSQNRTTPARGSRAAEKEPSKSASHAETRRRTAENPSAPSASLPVPSSSRPTWRKQAASAPLRLGARS